MAGWHHWLDGRESEWTPGDGDRQGGLACCDSWGRKESDMTERLNWTELRVSRAVIFTLKKVFVLVRIMDWNYVLSGWISRNHILCVTYRSEKSDILNYHIAQSVFPASSMTDPEKDKGGGGLFTVSQHLLIDSLILIYCSSLYNCYSSRTTINRKLIQEE